MKLRFYLFYFLLPLTLQSCVLNNPYRDVESNQNYVYNTFINPPKHLDPVISYSAGEYVWLQQIYEQPLQYHYLKRPEILIPMTAREVPQPV